MSCFSSLSVGIDNNNGNLNINSIPSSSYISLSFHLTHLDLSYNKITSVGTAFISSFLFLNKSVESLNLDGNYIGFLFYFFYFIKIFDNKI
jgi:Leucine-rich repeat (LRR) protein